MSKVKVLTEGYAKPIKNGWTASSTVILIQTNGKNIIVDPRCNRQKILEELSKNGLKTANINFVFLTHNHTDHVLLMGIFENAKVITSLEVYNGDEQIEYEGQLPELGLGIIETPGHSDDSKMLLAETEDGRYAIAGDVFWWKEGEEQRIDVNKPDPYAEESMESLIKSRKKVLDLADWIIPGHGKMFKGSRGQNK